MRESREGERRVAIVPASVEKLRAQGFEIEVERGAGERAGYPDADYERAGATLADAWSADVVVKVNPPTTGEAQRLRDGAILIALVYPARNEALLETLKERGATAIALDRVPRITRAQAMDVLSSMANLAGYRAVLEAASAYEGSFGAQVTAAGTLPPARVLVIGAGVAGLAAIAAARALGAEVRAFDTRLAAREQVQSLGASFLEVELEESGEGEGGYAKVMSKEFIEAEMKLFREQAAEVNVIVTTALVPGAKAPILVPRDVAEAMRPGSVIVDLAAEQGGNCELTVPGEKTVHNGVAILGYTDLVSRMAHAASRFFSANVVNLLKEMSAEGGIRIDLENEIVRGACVVHAREILPPPKPPEPAKATRPSRPPPAATAEPAQKNIMSPTRRAWGTTLGGMLVVLFLFVVGRFAPETFLQHLTVFVLACFVGWQVIWSVTPALHTPLMSVTNAISGIIIVGGMLQVGREGLDLSGILGMIAILFAAVNVSGGFLVTQRMLSMFRKDPDRR